MPHIQSLHIGQYSAVEMYSLHWLHTQYHKPHHHHRQTLTHHRHRLLHQHLQLLVPKPWASHLCLSLCLGPLRVLNQLAAALQQ